MRLIVSQSTLEKAQLSLFPGMVLSPAPADPHVRRWQQSQKGLKQVHHHKVAKPAQPSLASTQNYIVPNHWGPAWHIINGEGRTVANANNDAPMHMSIERAREWAALNDVTINGVRTDPEAPDSEMTVHPMWQVPYDEFKQAVYNRLYDWKLLGFPQHGKWASDAAQAVLNARVASNQSASALAVEEESFDKVCRGKHRAEATIAVAEQKPVPKAIRALYSLPSERKPVADLPTRKKRGHYHSKAEWDGVGCISGSKLDQLVEAGYTLAYTKDVGPTKPENETGAITGHHHQRLKEAGLSVIPAIEPWEMTQAEFIALVRQDHENIYGKEAADAMDFGRREDVRAEYEVAVRDAVAWGKPVLDSIARLFSNVEDAHCSLGNVRSGEELARMIVRTIQRNPNVPETHSGKQGADPWMRNHMTSKSFTLMEVPIDKIDWFGPQGDDTEYKGLSQTSGPIVLDKNKGTGPSVMIALDGTHRLHERREAGDKTILAWVGDKIAGRFIEPVGSDARERAEALAHMHGSRPEDLHKSIAADLTAALAKPGMNLRELIRAVRVSLAAEEEAANLYEAVADATSDSRAKKVMQSIADEEKVHAGEFAELLRLLDPKEDQHEEKGAKEVRETVAPLKKALAQVRHEAVEVLLKAQLSLFPGMELKPAPKNPMVNRWQQTAKEEDKDETGKAFAQRCFETVQKNQSQTVYAPPQIRMATGALVPTASYLQRAGLQMRELNRWGLASPGNAVDQIEAIYARWPKWTTDKEQARGWQSDIEALPTAVLADLAGTPEYGSNLFVRQAFSERYLKLPHEFKYAHPFKEWEPAVRRREKWALDAAWSPEEVEAVNAKRREENKAFAKPASVKLTPDQVDEHGMLKWRRVLGVSDEGVKHAGEVGESMGYENHGGRELVRVLFEDGSTHLYTPHQLVPAVDYHSKGHDQ